MDTIVCVAVVLIRVEMLQRALLLKTYYLLVCSASLCTSLCVFNRCVCMPLFLCACLCSVQPFRIRVVSVLSRLALADTMLQQLMSQHSISGVEIGDVLHEVDKLYDLTPNTKGGTRTWRSQCATVLTKARRTLPPLPVTKFILSELTKATRGFKGNSAPTWRPHILLCMGFLGVPLAKIKEMGKNTLKDWDVHLAFGASRATKMFKFFCPDDKTECMTSPVKSPVQKRSAETSDIARSEIARVLTATTSHDVLGTLAAGSHNDVNRAYRRCLLLVHPDKCHNAPGAQEAFIRLRHAREVMLVHLPNAE